MVDERIDNPGQSDKGLIGSIARFSDLLRDHGVSVSLPAVLDSIEALPLIDISNLNVFHCLLQANFVSRKEDITIFDKLFNAFWLSKPRSRIQIAAKEAGRGAEKKDTVSVATDKMSDLKSHEDHDPKSAAEWALRYSPEALSRLGETQELRFNESTALYESICKLLRPLHNRLSRRTQYTVRGKEISLRRILRKNMQFGGELIFLDFKKKKLKKRRLIFFCDVSGSMDIYTLMILQFIHALKRIDRRTEIFLFSTDLSRTTDQFDDGDFTTDISRLPELITDWGGGTRIGYCLKRFNDIYGRRMLSSKDIVMIFSDGWDRGEIDVLETQMMYLKRKAYKIIWLNPLLGTKDYQPICLGMGTALPYVDFFLPIGHPPDLHFLGHTLAKIIA
jgi:uncharacterized protein with von Willebrand factor type A (vWA) domain